MPVGLEWRDDVGTPYDLLTTPILFDKLQLGEQKRIPVYLKAIDFTVQNILVQAIPHPTEQKGTAEDTYAACKFALVEGGPYTDTLNITSLSVGSTKEIFVQWTAPAGALPGIGFYAIEAKGKSVWS